MARLRAISLDDEFSRVLEEAGRGWRQQEGESVGDTVLRVPGSLIMIFFMSNKHEFDVD